MLAKNKLTPKSVTVPQLLPTQFYQRARHKHIFKRGINTMTKFSKKESIWYYVLVFPYTFTDVAATGLPGD